MADSERITVEEYRAMMPTVEQVDGWSMAEAAEWLLGWAQRFGVILVDHDGRIDWLTYGDQFVADGFAEELQAFLGMVRSPPLEPEVRRLMRLAQGVDEGWVASLLARHPGIRPEFLLELVDWAEAVW